MTLLDLLSKLASFVIPNREVRDTEGLILRRFYLTPLSWKKRVFIDHMNKGNPGKHPHDHPWFFTSIVLWGSFMETLPRVGYIAWNGATIKHRRRAWLSRVRYLAQDIHQIQIAKRTQALVLIVANRPSREWGFWVEGKWVNWRGHLGLPLDANDYPENLYKRF